MQFVSILSRMRNRTHVAVTAPFGLNILEIRFKLLLFLIVHIGE